MHTLHRSPLTVAELLSQFTQAIHAGDAGHYEDAIELTCELLNDQRIRPEDRGRFYRYLIQWSVECGNPSQARFYASQAVRELKGTLGATHEMTLQLRSSELFWMCESGMADIAHRRFPDLIRDVEEHLEPRHELRWAVLMNAVIPLKQQGNFTRAAQRYERILGSMRRRPPRDPLTLILARDNYAELLACAGNYERSLEQYGSLLEDVSAVFGERDPRTLMLRNRIAGVRFDAGQDEEAWEEWTVLLPVFDDVCGPSHPESARLRSLCLLHALEQGKEEEALGHAETLLAFPREDSDESDQAMIRAVIAELRGEAPAAESDQDGQQSEWEPGQSFYAPDQCPCALCSGDRAA
ncbi:hypothetical protein [Schaalia canis]|uniref:Tetratricopeptide repeat protein n=1 Tax=Schaalia canis TaxID=100469 RepID=A0A3P1SBB7_9ACTO|nr:hypothetical protein [Schaalia canis]RRC94561.1 hypothetical protein EII11_09620 [Schaalia canis]